MSIDGQDKGTMGGLTMGQQPTTGDSPDDFDFFDYIQRPSHQLELRYLISPQEEEAVLQELINRLNLIFIELEDLLGTTTETDNLEVAIQDLEKLLPKT